jgi:hypothetical protein
LNNYILFEKILKWSFEDKKKCKNFFEIEKILWI